MTDNNGKTVAVGDTVKHRWRDYPNGVIQRIDDGCNAVAWADFGREFPTIIISSDIVKID